MTLLKKLKKTFGLPTVVDLGWSDSNALPMRRFQPGVQGWTWEDYHEEMKVKYPIRYFFFETFVRWFSVHVTMPLEHAKWYVRDNLVRRTHMLDLRQTSWVDGCDDYSGGYIDPLNEILYACMNSLNRFISETHGVKHADWLAKTLAEKPVDDPSRGVLEDNYAMYTEAIAIHKWWNIDRKSDFMRMSNTDDYTSPEASKATFARWDAFEAKEDEMLVRLMKIRRGLWS